MNKITLFVLLTIIASVIGFCSLNPSPVEPTNSNQASNHQKVQFLENIKDDNTTKRLVSNDKQALITDAPSQNNKEVVVSEEQNEANARMEKRVAKLIVDITSASEDNLKDLLFENENIATAEKVITLLSIKDFNVLVDSFKEKDRSSYSMEREGKLFDALKNNLAGRYYNEKYACAGKLCVLEFTHSADLEIADVDKIEEFDTNFVFLDYSGTTLQGDKVFQVLFVATDDPSKLGFRG